MSWSSVNWHPSERQLRLFAVVASATVLALAGWVRHQGAAPLEWAVLAVISCGLGLLGTIKPALVRPLYVGASLLFVAATFTLCSLVLLVLFFGLLTPLGLYSRLAGQKVARRRVEPIQPTYWRPTAGALRRQPAR